MRPWIQISQTRKTTSHTQVMEMGAYGQLPICHSLRMDARFRNIWNITWNCSYRVFRGTNVCRIGAYVWKAHNNRGTRSSDICIRNNNHLECGNPIVNDPLDMMCFLPYASSTALATPSDTITVAEYGFKFQISNPDSSFAKSRDFGGFDMTRRICGSPFIANCKSFIHHCGYGKSQMSFGGSYTA